MVSEFDVTVEIEAYPREARNAKNIKCATDVIYDYISENFGNDPQKIRVVPGDMGGYSSYITLKFALRGTDIQNASERAFKILLKKIGYYPRVFSICTHVFGDSDAELIPEDEEIVHPIEK